MISLTQVNQLKLQLGNREIRQRNEAQRFYKAGIYRHCSPGEPL